MFYLGCPNIFKFQLVSLIYSYYVKKEKKPHGPHSDSL
jgi:hypothetical protein